MSRKRRFTLGLAVLFMSLGLFLPIWRIDIWAPQYPEGLTMQIGANQIVGNIDQINILNHYIGMKRIVPAEIPELTVIPWMLGGLIALGALVVLLNKTLLARAWLGLVGIASLGGLIDFYRWGYDYGHNLNPQAPIKIPGLSYQPPLFGYKKLLNIEAYSLPDWGGYILAISLVAAFIAINWDVLSRCLGHSEIFRLKSSAVRTGQKISSMILVIFLCGLISCTSKPEALKEGVDFCEHCHMRISDARFGGEIVTKKGRIYKFDSIHCLHDYLAKNPTTAESVLVADYFHPGNLIEAAAARFLVTSKIPGPMGSGPLASGDQTALQDLQKKSSGHLRDWKEVFQSSL